jgi:cyclophilin family peptidyl-prolyl cis-trans isomerase
VASLVIASAQPSGQNTASHFFQQSRSDRATNMTVLRTLALVTFLAGSCWQALAQDATAPNGAAQNAAGGAPAVAEFNRVYGEWRNMLANLAELQGKYQKASESEQAAIERQYNDVRKNGEEIAERLKKATEAAFVADPTNKQVSTLLSRIAFTNLIDDHYEEAERLAKLGLKYSPGDLHMANVAANAAFNLDKFAEVEPLITKAAQGRPLQPEIEELVGNARQYVKLWEAEQKLREAESKADNLPRVKLETTKGDIVVELFEDQAPNTVANFISLVQKGFYNGVPFHRVIANFMAQGGDPTGTGGGGPGYRIKDEVGRPNARMHFRGSLSMAKTSAPDTGGSQFFLTFKPTPHLNGLHTVFGRVIEGMDVLAKLNRVEPPPTGGPTQGADKIVKATVLRKRDHEYKPATLPEAGGK